VEIQWEFPQASEHQGKESIYSRGKGLNGLLRLLWKSAGQRSTVTLQQCPPDILHETGFGVLGRNLGLLILFCQSQHRCSLKRGEGAVGLLLKMDAIPD